MWCGQIRPLHQANKSITNPSMINQMRWVQAPQAMGTSVSNRTTSIVGVMYFDTYLPNGEFLTFSTLGGQIIIAPETIVGGINPATSAGAILWRQRKKRKTYRRTNIGP